MLILALDSTATVSTVALIRDGKILSEYTVNAGNTQSVTLLPMAEHIMKCCDVTVDDIDMFAGSAGPGSFTGVRIGAATLKGLAFKNNTPTVPVSALEALAENLVGFEGIICPAMNARRNQVYTALFRNESGKQTRLTDDLAISLDELRELIAEYKKADEKLYFTGDGYFMVEDMTEDKTPERLRLQSAVSVAAVAERVYEAAEDKAFLPENFTPTYLRKPQAEREREERMRENDN